MQIQNSKTELEAFYQKTEKVLDTLKRELATSPTPLASGYVRLDEATRLLVGLKCDADEARAEKLLRDLANDASVPDDIRASAWSELIYVVEPRLQAQPDERWGGGLDERLFFAVQAATLGLYSEAVLHEASRFRHLRESGPIKTSDPLATFMRATLAPLWKAADASKAWRDARDAGRKRKVEKHPDKYRCANPKCTVESLGRGPLMKCAGKCDDEFKPYYCEKSCQIAHWKAHKPYCKPGMDRHSEPVPDREDPRPVQPDLKEPSLGSNFRNMSYNKTMLLMDPNRPQDARSIKSLDVKNPVTGEKVTIQSNGSLQDMKDLAKELERLANATKPS